MLNLSHEEIRTIILAIEPEWRSYAIRYDEVKYPPAEIVRLRAVFSTIGLVPMDDVEAALIWKYGHTGKANYPDRHRELAAKIARLWTENAVLPEQDMEGAFRKWRHLLGPTSFITVCFLLHLVNPGTMPILDQHNYRSVSRHLMKVRPAWLLKAKPSTFGDLLLVREFGVAVLGAWEKHVASPKPSTDDLDRYLMMHGKSLKATSRRH